MRVRRERRFLLMAGAVLVVVAAVLYAGNILYFRLADDTFYYFWIDLAFIPLEVLIVAVIVERVISRREKGAIAQKLNMVIGAFFSELGTPLLAKLLPTMLEAGEIREHMHLKASWKKDDFSGASQYARGLKSEIDLSQVDLYELRTYLLEKRDFILRLLENPNLIEHDRFTDLLWAVMHVVDELEARPVLTGLQPCRRSPPATRRPPGVQRAAGGVGPLRGAPQGELPVPVLAGGADAPVPGRRPLPR